MGAGRLGKLRTQGAADIGAQRTFPGAEVFEQRALSRRLRGVDPELMGILELLKEFRRIVHSIDAELKQIKVPGAQGNDWFSIRRESFGAREREIGFVLALSQEGRGGGEEDAEPHDLIYALLLI
jgi:hypothetical protein